MQDVYCTNDHEELWLKVFVVEDVFFKNSG